jgi:hypothetical protein
VQFGPGKKKTCQFIGILAVKEGFVEENNSKVLVARAAE